MHAKYSLVIRVEVEHEIEQFDGLKSDREFAQDLCEMICDEAVSAGAVATYKVLHSGVDVR